jgi:hypothetical protein
LSLNGFEQRDWETNAKVNSSHQIMAFSLNLIPTHRSLAGSTRRSPIILIAAAARERGAWCSRDADAAHGPSMHDAGDAARAKTLGSFPSALLPLASQVQKSELPPKSKLPLTISFQILVRRNTG